MRILVVEDERSLAGTLADILGRERYLVDLAYDGEEGLDCALSGIYDGMILDVMLPKLSGFEVLRRLRQSGSALPVLMLTARSELSDRVAGLDAGADYYLTKPFERRSCWPACGPSSAGPRRLRLPHYASATWSWGRRAASCAAAASRCSWEPRSASSCGCSWPPEARWCPGRPFI